MKNVLLILGSIEITLGLLAIGAINIIEEVMSEIVYIGILMAHTGGSGASMNLRTATASAEILCIVGLVTIFYPKLRDVIADIRSQGIDK